VEPVDPELAAGPPANPEDWTDEQWLRWLRATDDAPDDGPAPPEGRPVTAMGRITRSAGGEVITLAMQGLAQAMFGQKNEIVIVAEGNSEPDGDEPLSLHLDPDHPERSTVVVRPVDEPPPAP
jgi:hypothetical protein